MPRRVYNTLAARLEAFRCTDVYPVVTSEFCAGRHPAEVAASLLAGGVRILQIREKTMPDRPFLDLLRQVRELTWDYGALLIVDDRVDAALIAQADAPLQERFRDRDRRTPEAEFGGDDGVDVGQPERPDALVQRGVDAARHGLTSRVSSG